MKKSYALAMAIAALTGAASAQDVAKEIESAKSAAAAADAKATAAKSVAAAAEAKAAATDAKLEATDDKLDATKGKLDGLEESYLETKSTVDALAKIKVTGLIQARAEIAIDTGKLDAGLPTTTTRFKVRRGRLKVSQAGTLGDWAVQAQYGEKGIELQDIYGTAYDPWGLVKLRLGAQDIPFGYEIGYSSSSMETMERSLAEQKIFKGEKDLGAVLFLAYDKDYFKYVDFKVGVMNGQMNVTTQENDNGKAFLGRLGFKLPVKDLNFEVDGGGSYYYNTLTARGLSSVLDYDNQLDGHTDAKNKYAAVTSKDFVDLKKKIVGADLQVYVNLLPFGGTVLRGELYTGTNVSLDNNNHYDGTMTATTTYTTTASTDSKGVTTYTTKSADTKSSPAAVIRPVLGWYGTLIQNIGNDFQVVARYEQFDQNTELEGDAIGAKNSAGTVVGNSNDLAWSQISLGLNYFLSGNVKLSLAYDIKTNETTANTENINGKGKTNDRNDWSKEIDNNLTTLQLQYKF